MLKISVIICSYNPRKEYLNRTLDSLKRQTLPLSEWELLLVDNKSSRPLSKNVDLSWHPGGRHIIEEELGLTSARMRGIREAANDLLLFVDDDNCLNTNYLSICLREMLTNELIGVIGAGKIIPEYEVAPPDEVLPYVGWLALRNNTRPHYSNEVRFTDAIPLGAGMCIRKDHALNYIDSCKNRALASTLDRTGDSLLSCGDVDLALHACKAGKIAAVIPELSLLHLIPSSRLQPDYLIRLMAGHAFSLHILSKLWNYSPSHSDHPVLVQYRYHKQLIKYKGLDRRIFVAQQKAIAEASAAWLKTVNS